MIKKTSLMILVSIVLLLSTSAGQGQTLSVGAFHAMMLKGDGSLWAWGKNDNGQLGDGTRTIYDWFDVGEEYDELRLVEDNDKLTPVKVMDNVMSVSAGASHSLAVRSDGGLWAWGCNEHGEIGDGTTTDVITPVKVMDNVSVVSASSHFSMAVKTDGSLWAWGDNNSGQLGDGTSTKRISPVKIMDNAAAASLGAWHTLVVKTEGTLWGFGNNNDGQLGDGTKTNRHLPIKIMNGAAVLAR